MRFIKFIIAAALTLGLGYFLNTPLSLKEKVIPPVMPLLNPFSGFWGNAANSANIKSDTYKFQELSAPVKVVWDKRLVPHIFAQSTEDALFVQGYVTAKHRLFQMDLMRRDAAGQLSEAVGKIALPRDKMRRRQGILWAAENAVDAWKNSEDFRFIDSYVKGVNAFSNTQKEKEKALEFKLLGYEPEAWDAVKTALVVKNMALSLCFRNNDIAATNTLKAIGKENYDFLFPDWNPKQSPIIPKEKKWNFTDSLSLTEEDFRKVRFISHTPYENPPENIGSNNWAISAEKSATGNPILCNDPHLNLSFPAIWFEIQIHTPEFNAYGVSVPGIPGILIGFNENIAWGETNVGQDILDWYEMEWTDQSRSAYLFDGKEIPTTMREEIIHVKGLVEPIIDTVIYTHLGPVALPDESDPSKDLAMRWLAHDRPNGFEFNTFLNLMRSKNYEDYREALLPYVSPAQNFVFASKDNDIAITANGKFPLKRRGQGRFISKGNSSDNLWQGFISKEEIPQIKNPIRGFVASANQHSTDPSYPHYYNGGFEDYRGRYLNRKLAEQDKFSIKDMADLQNDNYSLKAEEALPILLKSIDETELNTTQKGVLNILKKWDYRYQAEAIAPIIFDAWWKEFYTSTWDELKDEDIKYLRPEVWRTIALMESEPNSKYWDIKETSQTETRNDLALISFKKAVEGMPEEVLKGNLNYTQKTGFFINHLLRLAPFNVTDLPISGTSSALNANRPGNGPSWRMIVELGDEVSAQGVYPGGQSGDPTSPYFQTMLDKWANGEYYDLLFLKSSDVAKADEILLVEEFE